MNDQDRIARLEAALLELDCVARAVIVRNVTDEWEQNRLMNEIANIVKNGRES